MSSYLDKRDRLVSLMSETSGLSPQVYEAALKMEADAAYRNSVQWLCKGCHWVWKDLVQEFWSRASKDPALMARYEGEVLGLGRG